MSTTRLLPILYVDITDPELKGITEENVRLRLTDKGYVVSGVIENISILDPNLRKVQYRIRPIITEPDLPTTYDFDGIYLEDGIAVIYVDTIVDVAQLRRNAVANKTKRNKLLEATDWIEVSSAVTTETKSAYKAYRQLLRDIFLVIDETRYTQLPTAPDVVMKNSKQIILKDDVVQKIKNYVPIEITGWDVFLKEWSNLNFTPNRLIITSLLAAYTDTTYSLLSRNL